MPVNIKGSTSGSVELKAPDTGGDAVVVLPGTSMDLGAELAAKAPLASPGFTGTPSLPSGTTLAGNSLGLWSAYTPTWTATGGTPTIGNGSLNGAFAKTGRIVHFRFSLYGGSTTSWGTTTDWKFSLPVTAATTLVAVNGMVYNANTGAGYRACGYFDTTSTMRLWATDSTTPIGYNSPGTWAANWVLMVAGTYDSAA
jgi:hypothetical protein